MTANAGTMKSANIWQSETENHHCKKIEEGGIPNSLCSNDLVFIGLLGEYGRLAIGEPMSLPCVKKKGLGVHRKASEYQGGQECLIKTVEEKEDWLASATDTQSHNHQCSAKDATGRWGCLSNLTPLIRQVGLGSRQGPSGNASALICRVGQGSISTIASVCNCLDRSLPLL